MEENAHEQEDLNELKFSRELGFFDKSRGVTLVIGALLLITLFLTLHFRDVRLEIPEVGTRSPKYVVAQEDFDFVDREATIILKQEAVQDVGVIYSLSEDQIRERRAAYENKYIESRDWSKPETKVDYDQVTTALNALVDALYRARFTDPRTLQKIRHLKFPNHDFIIFTPVFSSEMVIFPQQVWKDLYRNAFQKIPVSSEVERLIEGFFQGSEWSLVTDNKTQGDARKKLQEMVPEKKTRMRAGSRVLNQDEKVTPRDVAMLQALKRAMRENRNLWSPSKVAGSLILSILFIVLSYVYMTLNHPKVIASNRKIFLLTSIVIATLAAANLAEYFLLNAHSDYIEQIHYPIFLPFVSILVCCLFSTSIASFMSVFVGMVMMLGLAFEPRGFFLINIATAYVAVFGCRGIKRRKEIFFVCAKAWLCAVVVILSIHLYRDTNLTFGILLHTSTAAFFMLLISVAVVGLLPLLEATFRVMTDATLMEYMDPNNDLLRRLSIEAPGTYQHSVVVGNLAEAAALAIGANGLFCRVATLYHDIGKMATPQYFTENQQGGMNIHQLLTPQESAQVIMAHVSEGVSMARKAGLPEQFIDVIKEHHGTTLIAYFYQKQLEKMGDPELVDEREFRYAGPTPRTQESVIIMIADTLEAASRCLEKIDEQSLTELATQLIREKMEDGQFNRCLLTFEELAIVKSTIVKTLVAYGHSRVKYPRRPAVKQESKIEPLVYNGG